MWEIHKCFFFYFSKKSGIESQYKRFWVKEICILLYENSTDQGRGGLKSFIMTLVEWFLLKNSSVGAYLLNTSCVRPCKALTNKFHLRYFMNTNQQDFLTYLLNKYLYTVCIFILISNVNNVNQIFSFFSFLPHFLECIILDNSYLKQQSLLLYL